MKLPVLLLALTSSAWGFGQTTENEIVETARKRTLSSYEVHVSPNPSTDNVVVHAPEGSICALYSANGTYVGTWEIRGEGLALENLGSGIFLAHITFEGEMMTKRFVIL